MRIRKIQFLFGKLLKYPGNKGNDTVFSIRTGNIALYHRIDIPNLVVLRPRAIFPGTDRKTIIIVLLPFLFLVLLVHLTEPAICVSFLFYNICFSLLLCTLQ